MPPLGAAPVAPVAPAPGVQADRGPTVGDPTAARSALRLSVVTPEAVLLELPAAGIGSRLLAVMLDLLVQGVALVVVLFTTVVAVATAGTTVGVILVLVAVFLVVFGYPALCETFFDGRTLGKLVLGIRVITTEGGPVTFRHAAIRSILALFDFWIPTPGGLVALTSALVTSRSQRLGDLAAGTVVVRQPRARTSPVFFGPAYGAEGLVAVLDTSALGPQQYSVVRDYLLRLGQLTPEQAEALGQELAGRVGELTGTPCPPWLDPPRYLASVLCAHQQRARAGTGASAPIVPPAPGAAWGPPPPPTGFSGPPPGGGDAGGWWVGLPPPSGPPVVVGR